MTGRTIVDYLMEQENVIYDGPGIFFEFLFSGSIGIDRC